MAEDSRVDGWVQATSVEVGASGAVFGVMPAAVVGMRERGANPFRTGLGMTFAINIAFTLAIPGVSIGGHFGGAIAGALCGAVILAPAQWRLPAWSVSGSGAFEGDQGAEVSG